MTDKNNFFASFPEAQELIKWHLKQKEKSIPGINGHIHTPHSFSAFTDIEQAFQLAQKEGIKVLGINDFYTTGGYDEFAGLARKYRIFPLFNIEFMTLQHDLQKEGVRVNDPNNPGRTYLSGKGLRFPVNMSEHSLSKMRRLQTESNRQTYQMVDKLNDFFEKTGIDLFFDAAELQKKLAKTLFRERHIAQAVRLAVFEKESSEAGRMELFQKIFLGKSLKSSIEDFAGVENEIRGNLLKTGGAAFVPEDADAFLTLEEAVEVIIDAGGITCYPVLLDDAKGNFTDYEEDWEKLLQALIAKDIYSVELIPGRNDFQILKKFVAFFYENGFVVTFGTEHNTPQLTPLEVTCRGGVPLDAQLRDINYEGAAILAAHQYLVANGEEGYLKGKEAKIEEKEWFADLGKAVISYFQKM